MKDIEKLPLVFVKPLYLHIKNRSRVNNDSIIVKDILCKTLFISELNVHELFLRLLIIGINLYSLNLRKIGYPFRSDMLCYPVCKKRICMKQETSLGYAVRFVVEFLRHHLVEIMKLPVLQNLRMKSCNTIYGEACNYGKISHSYLTVINDGHISDLVLTSGIHFLNPKTEPSIDFLHNLIYSRQKS